MISDITPASFLNYKRISIGVYTTDCPLSDAGFFIVSAVSVLTSALSDASVLLSAFTASSIDLFASESEDICDAEEVYEETLDEELDNILSEMSTPSEMTNPNPSPKTVNPGAMSMKCVFNPNCMIT